MTRTLFAPALLSAVLLSAPAQAQTTGTGSAAPARPIDGVVCEGLLDRTVEVLRQVEALQRLARATARDPSVSDNGAAVSQITELAAQAAVNDLTRPLPSFARICMN